MGHPVAGFPSHRHRGLRAGPEGGEGTKFRSHTMMSPDQTSAILPLSLLEALRNLDRPVEDGLAEFSHEVVAKRLGLNPTVSAQIARYQGLARTGAPVEPEEAGAVFALVGRRPDAPLVYADAGRRAARYAARSLPLAWRVVLGSIPASLRRRVGSRRAAAVARAVFGVVLHVEPLRAEARIESTDPGERVPDVESCEFIGAAMSELLRTLAGFEGAMVHRTCRSRGDAACAWRARAVDVDDPY